MTQIVPSSIAAGVTFNACAWRPEFSGTAWSMRLILRGPAPIDLIATRDAARHVWRVEATDTAQWAPGEYVYAIHATDGTDVSEVENGQLRIRADIAEAGPGYDGRSAARIGLDAIEAVIAKRATLDQERYRINNRELYRTSIEDLLKLRAHYARLVAREEGRRKGIPLFGRQLRVHMRRPR